MAELIFDSSTIYIPPKTRRNVKVRCFGAGGGGAGGQELEFWAMSGGGGGGGAYAEIVMDLVEGTPYIVHVGPGGAAGGEANPGGDGGATWFGSPALVLAAGGSGSPVQNYPDGIPAGPGGLATLSVGTARFSGGAGWSGDTQRFDAGGGGGGSSASQWGEGFVGSWGAGPYGGDGGTANQGGNGGHGEAPPSSGVSGNIESGFAPGGGGGGGMASQSYHLDIDPLTATIHPYLDSQGFFYFHAKVIDDWHTLVHAEVPAQLIGASPFFWNAETSPRPNDGIDVGLGIGMVGDAIWVDGYIQDGLTVIFRGNWFPLGAFGDFGADNPWTITLVGPVV